MSKFIGVDVTMKDTPENFSFVHNGRLFIARRNADNKECICILHGLHVIYIGRDGGIIMIDNRNTLDTYYRFERYLVEDESVTLRAKS